MWPSRWIFDLTGSKETCLEKMLHYYLTWVARYTFFQEKVNFFDKFHKRKILVCMKAMLMSSFKNTWSIKVVNCLIWVVRIFKITFGNPHRHLEEQTKKYFPLANVFQPLERWFALFYSTKISFAQPTLGMLKNSREVGLDSKKRCRNFV